MKPFSTSKLWCGVLTRGLARRDLAWRGVECCGVETGEEGFGDRNPERPLGQVVPEARGVREAAFPELKGPLRDGLIGCRVFDRQWLAWVEGSRRKGPQVQPGPAVVRSIVDFREGESHEFNSKTLWPFFHSNFRGAKQDPLFPAGAVRIGAARRRCRHGGVSLWRRCHCFRWTTWPNALPNAKEAGAEKSSDSKTVQLGKRPERCAGC